MESASRALYIHFDTLRPERFDQPPRDSRAHPVTANALDFVVHDAIIVLV
jgi:hypothetical protein